MNIQINKEEFVNRIISPASKLADNLLLTCDKKIDKLILKTLTNSSDSSVILLSECSFEGDAFSNIIIPEVKTFLRLFSNIEEDNITLKINDNQIVFEGKQFSFKYHLLDEEYYTNKKSLNEQKLLSLKYDTKFDITKNKFAELLKYNSIVPEAEKIYFYTSKNKNVIAQLGDKEKPNINEITTTLAESYNGSPLTDNLPVSIHSLLLLTFNTNEPITVEINTELKIFRFGFQDTNYILSGLVK